MDTYLELSKELKGEETMEAEYGLRKWELDDKVSKLFNALRFYCTIS